MNDIGSTTEQDESPRRSTLEPVRSLGTSPAGESYEVLRVRDDDTVIEDSEPAPERLVVKKLTRTRLPSPERFKQKFAALCRLEHPNLCPYRDAFLGETASRITRDFVEGFPLDEYLLRPITACEEEELAQSMREAHAEGGQIEESLPKPNEDTSDGLGEISDTLNEDSSSSDDDASDDDASDDDASDDDASDDDASDDDASENTDRLQGRSTTSDEDPEDDEPKDDGDESRPATLEIPSTLLEDSEAADRTLDLLILRLRRLIPQLVDALEYLHRFGHAHGNLTPANILITEDEKVVLSDYGLYPELDIPVDSRGRHTGHFAPETAEGEFLPESDLYSLGAILFEILAGQSYGGRRHSKTADGTDPTFAPVYLSEIVPHCPATWVDLIHALLATEPQQRPPLDEVHRQLAATELRSVNIPAEMVRQADSLYGRNDSLDHLVECSQSCSRDRSLRMVVVEGSPGVGKTALLEAIAGQSAQRGWIIFHGRCFQREPVSYQGWESIVDRLVHIIDDLPENLRRELSASRRRAARLFPQLATGTELTSIPRQAAVDGFRALLRTLSKQRPILICFDDIHWAGADSTRLLSDLAEQPAEMRVMVVATWRERDDDTDEPSTLQGEFESAPIEVDRVFMEGFSRDEAQDYVLQHAAHLTLRQQQQVLRRGGLNPLLIDEFIHEFDEVPDTDTDGVRGAGEGPDIGSADDASPVARTDDELDHHLRPFIQQRLADLGRAERLVVQLLAIASSPLSAEILAIAMERELGTQTVDLVSGHEVAESLIEKRLARTARPTDGALSPETPSYVVIHDLCRRVILEEIGQDHHARLCGLVADALGEDDDTADDLRFEYLLRAGRGDEASRAAVLAARSALHRFAYHRAARLWRWLLERDELQQRDRSRFANSLIGAGDYKAGIEQLDELIPAESTSTDLNRRRRRLRAYLSAGDRANAVEATDEALGALSISYHRRSMLDRLRHLPMRITTTTGRWSDASSMASNDSLDSEQRAKARLFDFVLQTSPMLLSERRGIIEGLNANLALKSSYGPLIARDRLQMIGDPWLPFLSRSIDKVQRWCAQATELADDYDSPSMTVRCAETAAVIARHCGELSQARQHLQRAGECLQAKSVSAPLLEARLTMLDVDCRLLDGDLEGAHNLSMRHLHRFRNRHYLKALIALCAADEMLLRGALDCAETQLDCVESFIGDDKNCLLHLWLMDRLTRLRIARGRAEVAVAHWDLLLDRVYSRRLRQLSSSRFIIHLNMSRCLAAQAIRQRRLRESHYFKTIKRLRRSIRRLGDLEPWMPPFERMRFFRLRAHLCLLRDRPRRALRNVERAEKVMGDDTPAILAAQNRESRGFVLAKMERPNARTALDEARAQYREFGAYLPLVLDGWPVPDSHARLGDET